MIRKKMVRESIVGKRIPFDDQMTDTCLQDDIVRWLDAFDAEQHLVNLRSQLTESENRIYAEYFLQRKNASQIASEQHMTETAVYGTIQRIRKKACRLLCLAIFFFIRQSNSRLSCSHHVKGGTVNVWRWSIFLCGSNSQSH